MPINSILGTIIVAAAAALLADLVAAIPLLRTGLSHKRAFSLLELSIVLVIIGLLTGGVLAGKSLIRNSELNAVTTEYQRYTSAINSFRNKYQAVPGDMNNATQFWGVAGGAANYCSAGYTGSTPPGGTCNGNGNGSIDAATVSTGGTAEMYQLWNQLVLAKMLEGNYTGFSVPSTTFACGLVFCNSVLGVNAPQSRMSGSGWSIQTFNVYGGDPWTYSGDYGTALVFGGQVTGGLPTAPTLKPEEAWNIDTKLDDGMPGTGQIIAHFWNNACALSTSNTDYSGTYNLANTSAQCSLFFTHVL